MTTIAYLSNQFPSPLEPYVFDEIDELRARGFTVIPTSIWRPRPPLDPKSFALSEETVYVWPIRTPRIFRAVGSALRSLSVFVTLLLRVVTEKNEPALKRLKCVIHTFLGAYYASLLRARHVNHIHVHHGYFGSWVAMTAARLLNIPFSLTLHGSDLLLHPSFLAAKLESCKFCVTISEFNREQILARFPHLEPAKIIVQRLGIDIPPQLPVMNSPHKQRKFTILNVGRLHRVKDHVFLLTACRELALRGVDFHCLIAGQGPERASLERLIKSWSLDGQLHLLGQLSRSQLDEQYRCANVFVLTSRSEGIPLVLMEAMAHGLPVIAPAITGIPELVRDTSSAERTGFLYTPDSLFDLMAKIEFVANPSSRPELERVRHVAYEHVTQNFHRQNNLAQLSDTFTALVHGYEEAYRHADPVLQQI